MPIKTELIAVSKEKEFIALLEKIQDKNTIYQLLCCYQKPESAYTTTLVPDYQVEVC